MYSLPLLSALNQRVNDEALLSQSFEIGFHPIIRRRRTSTPRIWYASLFAKLRGRYQPLRLVTGIRHVPYKERLQRVGLRSLHRRRLVVDIIADFKVLTSLLDVDPNCFFLPLG